MRNLIISTLIFSLLGIPLTAVAQNDSNGVQKALEGFFGFGKSDKDAPAPGIEANTNTQNTNNDFGANPFGSNNQGMAETNATPVSDNATTASVNSVNKTLNISTSKEQIVVSLALYSLTIEGDADKALQYANAAAKAKPDFAPAYFARALILAKKGDTDAASRSLQRAVILDESLRAQALEFPELGQIIATLPN